MRGEDNGSQLRNALGALRDTMGAVGNLDELLRSPRVAPKAVAAVLPDMAATLPSLRTDIDAARAVLSTRFDASATALLCDFILSGVDSVASEISGATGQQRSLTAGTRLALERSVEKLQQRLLGALPLWGLLVELWPEPSLPVDVHELLVLLRKGDQGHGLRGQVIPVGLDSGVVPAWLDCSPPAALTLIAVAASSLGHATSSRGLCMSVGNEQGRATLAVAARVPESALFELVVPPYVAPTDRCLDAAARAIGVEVQREPTRILLSWTAAPPPSGL